MKFDVFDELLKKWESNSMTALTQHSVSSKTTSNKNRKGRDRMMKI